MRLFLVGLFGFAMALGCALGRDCGEGTTAKDGECVAEDEADADTDVDTDTDTDADTDADTDSDTDTDPTTDSDGDGLTDAEERALGVSPYDADTDGDGYEDGHELAEGTDPLDPSSRIYEGRWPYNPDKDALVDPGWGGTAGAGDTLPRFTMVDQYGDTVDIYDFAGHGKDVVIQLGTTWEPCGAELAEWLAGHPSEMDGELEVGARDRVAAGDVYWVIVLFEGSDGGNIDDGESRAWEEEHGVAGVPVLADTDQVLSGWVQPAWLPTVLLFDQHLELRLAPDLGYDEVITFVAEGR